MSESVECGACCDGCDILPFPNRGAMRAGSKKRRKKRLPRTGSCISGAIFATSLFTNQNIFLIPLIKINK